MIRDPWVATLKPGDRVAIQSRFLGRYDIYTVSSVTPSGRVRVRINDKYEEEFNPDGYRRGSSTWDLARIEPVTDAVRESVLRSNLIWRINATSFKDIDTNTLERIVELLPKKEQQP